MKRDLNSADPDPATVPETPDSSLAGDTLKTIDLTQGTLTRVIDILNAAGIQQFSNVKLDTERNTLTYSGHIPLEFAYRLLDWGFSDAFARVFEIFGQKDRAFAEALIERRYINIFFKNSFSFPREIFDENLAIKLIEKGEIEHFIKHLNLFSQKFSPDFAEKLMNVSREHRFYLKRDDLARILFAENSPFSYDAELMNRMFEYQCESLALEHLDRFLETNSEIIIQILLQHNLGEFLIKNHKKYPQIHFDELIEIFLYFDQKNLVLKNPIIFGIYKPKNWKYFLQKVSNKTIRQDSGHSSLATE